LTGVDLSGVALFWRVRGQLAGAPSVLPAQYILANNYLVGPYANLAGADLTGADLSAGASLSNVRGQLAAPPAALPNDFFVSNNYIVGPFLDLTDADLSGQDLSLSFLPGLKLIGTNLTGANLAGATLSASLMIDTILEGADLSGTDLSSLSTFTRVSGQPAVLPSAFPSGYFAANGYIVGPNADLADANLAGANLTGISLANAELSGAEYDELTIFPSGSDYTVSPWGLAGGASPWGLGMISVPEPAMPLMLLVGAGSLAFARRMQKSTPRSIRGSKMSFTHPF
jgi:uncharacterized protein YjbI with pentapeptide repeats